MSTFTKKGYISPEMTFISISLESDIASGSQMTITGGYDGNEYTPQVDEWTLTDSESSGLEF